MYKVTLQRVPLAEPGLGCSINGRLRNHMLVFLGMSSRLTLSICSVNTVLTLKLTVQNNTRYGQKHILN